MNTKHPVTNNTAMAIYVAGAMIPPGETRHFDLEQIPPHLRPQTAEEEAGDDTQYDPLAELLGHSVKDITAALPDLATADVERLGELEQAKGDDARKTLLSALAEEILSRAAASNEGAAGAAE